MLPKDPRDRDWVVPETSRVALLVAGTFPWRTHFLLTLPSLKSLVRIPGPGSQGCGSLVVGSSQRGTREAPDNGAGGAGATASANRGIQRVPETQQTAPLFPQPVKTGRCSKGAEVRRLFLALLCHTGRSSPARWQAMAACAEGGMQWLKASLEGMGTWVEWLGEGRGCVSNLGISGDKHICENLPMNVLTGKIDYSETPRKTRIRADSYNAPGKDCAVRFACVRDPRATHIHSLPTLTSQIQAFGQLVTTDAKQTPS